MAVALVVLALHAVEVPDETSLSAASRTRFDAVVHLGVLLPISGSWKRGRTIAGAVTLAVERIELDASLLPGLRIQYEWLDAGCNVSQGITSLQALLKNSELSAVIGPGRAPCSPARFHPLQSFALPRPRSYAGTGSLWRSTLRDLFCLRGSGCNDACETTVRVLKRSTSTCACALLYAVSTLSRCWPRRDW